MDKENGTAVDDSIPPKFEIHRSWISPHGVQERHRHQAIEEVIIVTRGQLTLSFLENRPARRRTVKQDKFFLKPHRVRLPFRFYKKGGSFYTNLFPLSL